MEPSAEILREILESGRRVSNLFSVPIFFIVLRETIEAAIIVSVLLSLVENLIDRNDALKGPEGEGAEDGEARRKRVVRSMRVQIWAGTLVGLFIAVCIGAAFIAVFFTTLNDLWGSSEEIWEGTFSLIACIIIFVMGVTMMKIDRSKVKWQIKLAKAFDEKPAGEVAQPKWYHKIMPTFGSKDKNADAESRGGKWTLFILPLITVLREGLEAIVFVGGVTLGQSAKSIPIAAIMGLVCGLIIGYLIYASGSRLNLSIFLVVSTNILFLLGAGLFSKAVGDFERQVFNQGVGADVAELGNGPGSYDVRGSVWHLECCNPENNTDSTGWGIFNAILGWSNDASYGTILSYVFYWLLVAVTMVYLRWKEGRASFFGKHSAAGQRRIDRAAKRAAGGEAYHEKSVSRDGSNSEEEKKDLEGHPSESLPVVV
ncbi:iron permease FTR1 [Pseudohyphozyma bogoriensis]|nr:iron permease FTR1 [Pseudohyphozyma bogoriensis]